MSNIASSLEQEFAHRSQSEREAHITELRRLVAAGRGSVDVAPAALAFPLLIGFIGGAFVYGSLTSSRMSKEGAIGAFFGGSLVLILCALAIFRPRAPLFTLTEQGLSVRGALLPWESIEDYSVTAFSHNGFTSNTTIELLHAVGFTPPQLNVMRLIGRSNKNRKTGQYTTSLTLFVAAKGMNNDKLAQRIGEFLTAARARTELRRLGP